MGDGRGRGCSDNRTSYKKHTTLRFFLQVPPSTNSGNHTADQNYQTVIWSGGTVARPWGHFQGRHERRLLKLQDL